MAGIAAPIVVDLVPVITRLGAGLNKPITATRRFAIAQARIGLNAVAVITSLKTYVDDAVTASSELTTAQTRVAIFGVGVVTLLAFKRQDAIAAARWLARVGAGIPRILVTVITDLTGVDAPVTQTSFALSVAAIANL